MNTKRNIFWIAAMPSLLLAAFVVTALAAPATVPHSFVGGTPARASDVNANFQAVTDALTAQDDKIAELEKLLTGGGAILAAAHVSSSGPIVTRSFSNLPGSPPITVSNPWTGVYVVDFGTPVNGRYYSATKGNAGPIGPPLFSGSISVTPTFGDSHCLTVWVTDSAGIFTDNSFYIEVH